MMNLMGFDLDGLGNHNFDRGEQFFRNEIVPLADFDYLSANIVDDDGNTPAEWSKSKVFTLERGLRLGFVGFSNPDIPELTKPGSLGPFHVADPLQAVNAEAGRLARLRNDVSAIVAIGHLGATAGTLTNPTGPLVDLADGVRNVDVVIGDHTNFQVVSTRPNGVLAVENLSRGIRFLRVRVFIDMQDKDVVYSTSDFHRPWNIGVTPDPTIQARINELNEDLRPILATVIGIVRPCGSAVGFVRADRRAALRVARGQHRDRRDAAHVRDRLRDHQLGRPACRPDLPDDRQPGRLLSGVHASALPDHEGTGAGRAAVREPRRDRRRERRRAEDVPRERRLLDAGGQRPLPAGLGALLLLRHLRARRGAG